MVTCHSTVSLVQKRMSLVESSRLQYVLSLSLAGIGKSNMKQGMTFSMWHILKNSRGVRLSLNFRSAHSLDGYFHPCFYELNFRSGHSLDGYFCPCFYKLKRLEFTSVKRASWCMPSPPYCCTMVWRLDCHVLGHVNSYVSSIWLGRENDSRG